MSAEVVNDKASTSRSVKYTVVEAGVDWITLTGESEESRERVHEQAMRMLEDQMLAGHKLTKTVRNGYRISGAGGIQWGQGHQGWIVVLSGRLAQQSWLPFFLYARNCSRLDLQATVKYEPFGRDEVYDIYEESLGRLGERFEDHATLIKNAQKGSTMYYGSRTSSQMGRIYNKEKQSRKEEGYLQCVRFEVEFKKPLSMTIATWLCDMPQEAQGITGHVFGWFEKRGIICPDVGSYPYNELHIGRKETELDKKVGWLRNSVRGVYQQLRMAGMQTEADEALGVTIDIQTVNDSNSRESK